MSVFQINSNVGAKVALNAMEKTNKSTYAAQLKLATTKKINNVSDDTSGYAVGKSLEGKVGVMKAAQSNVGAAKDLLATAETSLQSISDLLNQIKAKVADATDPTKSKDSLAEDINALGEEIQNLMNRTEFNGTTLLSGTQFSSGFEFKTGTESSSTLTLGFTSKLGTLDLSAVTAATSATIGSIDVASLVTSVSNALGSIGNDTQRLEVEDEYLTSALTNAQSSIDRLFGANMAEEQLNATGDSIKQQSGISMLGQLNTAPQMVLSLFK
jgi:flagellin